MRVRISADQFALNPLQWITADRATATAQSPDGGDSFADPGFLGAYDSILGRVADAGFPAVMMKVPPTQTIPSYQRMVTRHGLRLAPGYVQLSLPEDLGRSLRPGLAGWFGWFDPVRRRAEESLLCGLDSVFLASDIQQSGRPRVSQAAAIGFAHDPGRLGRVIELLSTAVDVLAAEGVRPGLHNHVGTWIETEEEIVTVLDSLPGLWCGFDIGHLAWAGIDPARMVRRYRERVIHLHLKDIDLGVAAASRAGHTPYQAASAAGLFLEPGLGGIDLAGTLAELPTGFGGSIIIEVDRPSMHPDLSARTSWAWVLAHTEVDSD